MSTFGNESFGAMDLLRWVLIGVVVIVALKVGLALAGFAVKVVLFALFTLGPILLVGWLVVQGLRYFSRGAS